MKAVARFVGWVFAVLFGLTALATVLDGAAVAGLALLGLAVAFSPAWPSVWQRRRVALPLMFVLSMLIVGADSQEGAGLSGAAAVIPLLLVAALLWWGRFGFALPERFRAAPWRAQLTTPEFHRLVGVCEGVLADDNVDQVEAEFLATWLARSSKYREDPRSRPVVEAVERVLADGKLHPEESVELRAVLSEFCDSALNDEAPLPKPKAKPKPKPTARPQRSVSAAPLVEGPASGDIFEISYEDAKGDVSDRTIEYRSCSRRGDAVYVNAYCRARRAFRTFRADRIISAVNTGTGEWIDDPEQYFA